jgi:hypothetical protein
MIITSIFPTLLESLRKMFPKNDSKTQQPQAVIDMSTINAFVDEYNSAMEVFEAQSQNNLTADSVALLNNKRDRFVEQWNAKVVGSVMSLTERGKQEMDMQQAQQQLLMFKFIDRMKDVVPKYKRSQLPQLRDNLSQTISTLRQANVDYKLDLCQVGLLTPIQNELDGKKVLSILNKWSEQPTFNVDSVTPLFITKDDEIIDGHHTWAASLQFGDSMALMCVRIDACLEDVLNLWKK